MSDEYDVVIIGAGIIGCSVAFKLSQSENLRVAVIDKEEGPGIHQTGRNSGVIHSGVYYPKGSLKSETCLDGYQQLLSFLQEYDVPYQLTGKLIAATNDSEYLELDRLYKNAVQVGLTVSTLNGSEIRQIDKNLVSEKGFLINETGITDYRNVLFKFIEVSKSKGVDFLFSSQMRSVRIKNNISILDLGDKIIRANYLVNCAGLQCDRVYKLCTGRKSPVTIIPFKGEYFHIKPTNYSSNIPIYPVPDPELPFLGIHLTRMIDGSLNVGPNAVLSLDREGYDGFKINLSDLSKILLNKTIYGIVKSYGKTVAKELLKIGNKSYFEKNVKKYWSNFSKEDICGYSCGIRAQATENGKLLSDFRIEKSLNQIHVLNAPSPAATSCLSIADTIIKNIKS